MIDQATTYLLRRAHLRQGHERGVLDVDHVIFSSVRHIPHSDHYNAQHRNSSHAQTTGDHI
jgi:hypothetical protein